jgi:hypothetical protein
MHRENDAKMMKMITYHAVSTTTALHNAQDHVIYIRLCLWLLLMIEQVVDDQVAVAVVFAKLPN